ncbi:MAG: hypothetical protein IJX91_01205 [Clostridia bacterium]|nr:hypothetical protein [Clostridia bacterium]
MLGFKKKALNTVVGTVRASFNGFAVGGKKTKGVLTAGACKNCDCSDGYLRAGAGAREYIPSSLESVILAANMPEPDRFFFLAKKESGGGYAEKLGYISTAGTVYVYDESAASWANVYSFGKRMRPLTAIDTDGNASNLFIGEKGLYTCSYEGDMASTGVTAASRAACFFKGRLYYVKEPFTLVYSAPYSATEFTADIDDGGNVRFPSEDGKIVALLPFKEKLYLFYEYGIAELTPAGTAREFVFRKVGYGGGRIFGDSVGACEAGGEKAFFLAEDGVYAFDGTSTKKACKNLRITPVRGGQVCNHAVFEGKYFVVYPSTDGEKKGLIVDAESGEGYFAFAPEGVSDHRGLAFCSFGLRVRVLSKDGALPSGEERVFSAGGIDFDTRGVKTLKRLLLTGGGSVRVAVSDGKNTQSFESAFENGSMELKASLKGESFSIKLALEKDAEVRSVTAEAQTLGGIK